MSYCSKHKLFSKDCILCRTDGVKKPVRIRISAQSQEEGAEQAAEQKYNRVVKKVKAQIRDKTSIYS